MEFWALRLALADHVSACSADLGSLFTANGLTHRRLNPPAEASAAADASDSGDGGAGSGMALGDVTGDSARRGRDGVPQGEGPVGRHERRQMSKAERRERKRERRSDRRERKRRRRQCSSSRSSPESVSADALGKRGLAEPAWEVRVGSRQLRCTPSRAAEQLSDAAVHAWLTWLWQRTE